jgi:hypothetical protein
MAGPRERKKLQPRSPQAIANAAKFGRGIGAYDIDQAWNKYGPGYGNLPDKSYGSQRFPSQHGTPIHDLSFNVNRDAHNLKWVQEPMNKRSPGSKFYHGQPRGYFPPKTSSDYLDNYSKSYGPSYEGNMGSVLMNMEDLRDNYGEIDFLGNYDQVIRAEENLLNDGKIGTGADVFETPGRQMEGIPQDYPHIMDFYDYLNTLQAKGGNELKGIESIIEAARFNAGRQDKKWWAAPSI